MPERRIAKYHDKRKGQDRYLLEDGNLVRAGGPPPGVSPGDTVELEGSFDAKGRFRVDWVHPTSSAFTPSANRPGGAAPAAGPRGRQARRARIPAGQARPGGFVNPFAFVPLPATPSPRSAPAPHDRFSGRSGTLRVRIDALTPVFTAAHVEGADGTRRGKRQLAPLVIDGHLVLAAASLKGMIRGLAETLSGSCLRIVDGRRRLSHRPVIDPGDAAAAALTQPYRVERVDADGHLELLPLEAYALAIRDGRGAWLADLTDRTDGEEASFRVTSAPVVAGRSSRPGAAALDPAGSHHGWLKLSDVRGEDPANPTTRRKNQRVVRPLPGVQVRVLSPLVGKPLVDDYNQAIAVSVAADADKPERIACAAEHEGTPDAEKSRWGDRGHRHPLQVGDIVWAHQEPPPRVGAPVIDVLGPSQVTRRAYPKSVGDAIPAGFLPCSDPVELCQACRIFGMVAAGGPAGTGPGSVAGHVRIGWAKGPRPADVELEHRRLPVLSSPKPSFGAFYLLADERGAGGSWDREPEVAGRKFYWHTSGVRTRHPDEAEDQAADVEAVPAGTSFTFTLGFDNLADADVGLLLASIDPRLLGEGFEDAAHKFGMGKPAGLGSVALTVTSAVEVDRAARYRDLDAPEQSLDVASAVEAFKASAAPDGDVRRFGEFEHMAALRAVLSPTVTEARDVRYPGEPGKGFAWFKGRADALLLAEQVAEGLGQRA